MKQKPSVEGHWLPWREIGDSKEWGHPMIVSNRDNMLTIIAMNMASNSVWYLDQYLNAEDHAEWPGDWQPM